MGLDFLSAFFEKKEDWSRPAMQILALEGVVVVVVGVEKAREAEVLMLEELEHQVADTNNKEVGQHCGKQVGQKEEACRILDTCYQEGEEC